MTTDQFEQELAPFKDATNVHTVNKTVHYHREALRQNRPDFATMLETMAQAAKTTKDWKPLKMRLASYW